METLELIMGLEPREGNQQRLEELFHNLYYELAIPDDTNDTPTLNIVNVKAGREAVTAAQPCEPQFLEALIRDVLKLLQLAVCDTSSIIRDQHLEQDLDITAENLYQVIHQCYRLKAISELSPSAEKRDEILKIFSQVEQIIIKARAMTAEMEPENPSRKAKLSLVKEMPAFHPDKSGAKNPWNNWLDNSAAALPKWLPIQQKIPRVGDLIMRKIIREYQYIEADFSYNEFVVRDYQNDPIKLPFPGHDLTHMIWGGFATIPIYDLGFPREAVKTLDAYGRDTLEGLSEHLAISYEDMWTGDLSDEGEDLESTNCPYFRFAVAYRA